MPLFFKEPDDTYTTSSCRKTKRYQTFLEPLNLYTENARIPVTVLQTCMSIFSLMKKETSRLDMIVHLAVVVCKLTELGFIIASQIEEESCDPQQFSNFSTDSLYCDISVLFSFISLAMLASSSLRDDFVKKHNNFTIFRQTPANTNNALVTGASDDEDEELAVDEAVQNA